MKLTTSWSAIPKGVQDHLLQRVRGRSITADDLYRLKLWLASHPEVPEQDWYSDFGTFKLGGRGPLILTFLLPEHVPYGIELPNAETDDKPDEPGQEDL